MDLYYTLVDKLTLNWSTSVAEFSLHIILASSQ